MLTSYLSYMSETYQILSEKINEHYREEKGKEMMKRLAVLSITIAISGLILWYYTYNVLIIFILLAIMIVLLSLIVVIFRRDISKKKSDESTEENTDKAAERRKERDELIRTISNEFADVLGESTEALDEVELEIDDALMRLSQKRELRYKRISGVFLAVWWAPVVYLIKDVMSGLNSDFIPDNFESLIIILFGITTLAILGIIEMGELIDSFSFWIEGADLHRMKASIRDVRYYLRKQASSTNEPEQPAERMQIETPQDLN